MTLRRTVIVRRSGSVGGIGATCTTDADCPDQGKYCAAAGVCIAKICHEDSQCGQYGHCGAAGFCQPDAHECSVDTDCPASTICSDGYCIPKAKKAIGGYDPGSWIPDPEDTDLPVGPCNSDAVIRSVQEQIGTTADGKWGKNSQAALDAHGGDYKAFAPGCTGSVPHWTQSGGTQVVACKGKVVGDACGGSTPCCGILECKDGKCAEHVVPEAESSAVWWVVGGIATGLAILGAVYVGKSGAKNR